MAPIQAIQQMEQQTLEAEQAAHLIYHQAPLQAVQV
jgi:hypothetical protein